MSSERVETFSVGGKPQIDIAVSSEDVTVIGGLAGEIGIRIDGENAGDYIVTQSADSVAVTAPSGRLLSFSSGRLTVTIPEHTTVEVRTVSGDVHIRTAVFGLDVATASGDVRAGDVLGDVHIRAASGDCSFGDIEGALGVVTASGDVRAKTVSGSVSIASASGGVRIASVDGAVTFKTASGDLTIDRFDGATFDMKTMSGDVVLGIPRRRRLEIDLRLLAGGLRNRLPESDGSNHEKTITIRAVGMSGDVTLRGV